MLFCLQLLSLTLLTLIMAAYGVHPGILTILWILSLLPVCIMEFTDYRRKKQFYLPIMEDLESLKEKYLLHASLESPHFVEGQILTDLIFQMGKSMSDRISQLDQINQDYREYIDSWVHEIKTPVAALSLILENTGNYQACSTELFRIHSYIDQVLYYARSESAEKDFCIQEFLLEEPVALVLQKHASSFIYKKISLDLKDLHHEILSDKKWLEFILDQIIGNAIKYTRDVSPKITIECEQKQDSWVLTIEDNGIGIPAKDLGRIFDKGFTGENGRVHARSTGMGLYLCKKLCDKLAIGLQVESEPDHGTRFFLIFHRDSMYRL